LLVLTGESDKQAKVFYNDVPVGQRLLVFGAVHTNTVNPMAAPDVLEPEPASNYRRWWNNSWAVVEQGGQPQAGDWTKEDQLLCSAWSNMLTPTDCGFGSTRSMGPPRTN
jgi:hypothetical protein